MACIKRKFMPENGQQLEESIRECTEIGLMPIMQAGMQVKGKNLLDAKELIGKDVAFINVEKLKKKKCGEPVTKFIKQDQKEVECQTSLLDRLQLNVGNMPKFEIVEFQNWAGNQTSTVISCNPQTKEEMSNVIKAARDEKVGIRCAGSRHSWAPVFADSCQICVNINTLKSDYTSQTNIRIADACKGTVDVMAGVTTGDLKTFQLQTKLNLNTNVILDLVQMVSVAQTGCHGVGIDTHCLSDYLVKMRVFDSNGELRTYSSEGTEEDIDLFRAVSAGFGCFGIVYDMTIKMDPEIIVKTCNFYRNMNDTFHSEEKLRDLIHNNWAVEIFWFPFSSLPFDLSNDEIWVRTFNKISPETIEKVEDVEFYETQDNYDYITQTALEKVSPIIVKRESIVPLMQWLSFRILKNVLYPEREKPLYQEIPNAVHFRKYLEKAKVYDLEFVFDYNVDYTRLIKIIDVVVEEVKRFKGEKGQYPLNVSLEMRFMTYSDAYLGTGSVANPKYGGSGHVVCIEVLCLKETQSWAGFNEAVGQKWIELGGVPHLAKQYDQLEGIFEKTRSKMAHQIEAFKGQLTKSGADPSGMFLNTGMRKLLFQEYIPYEGTKNH